MSDAVNAAEHYITFRLADKVLMSPLALIEEVTDPLPVTEIPGTHSWFQGLASKKGRLVPVSDLGDYAIQKPSRYENGAKWLIVTRDAETIGLIVDEVIGLTESTDKTHTDSDSPGASAASLDNSRLAALVTDVIAVKSDDERDETAAVIDLGRLLTQQNFVQVGVAAS